MVIIRKRLKQLFTGVVIFVCGMNFAKADTVIKPVSMIASQTACENQFGDFNWFCRLPASSMWKTVYGKSFWKLGQLKVYRCDLDSDGLEDVSVEVEFGFCSRGSTVCSHFFPFGDQPPPVANSFSGYSIMAGSAPVLTLRRGG
ncbi:MAG: hypothetical protein QM492_05505 [Rhodobacterales bacterium]